ncbi:MAG: acyl carrier protein [Acidisphaera sp.]|nr:acyl carrier protein [Acidisphaera sp.]
MEVDLRATLDRHGRLDVPAATLADDADLYAAGLDSLAIVNIMLAIEETFQVEFPDSLLSRQSFSSIASLERIIRQLQSESV